MADSSNDPQFLRLKARHARVDGREEEARANEAKATKIEMAGKKATKGASKKLQDIIARPSADAVAKAQQNTATLKKINDIGRKFQQKIDMALNNLVVIFADRDYKSNDAHKMENVSAKLNTAITLLEHWKGNPELQKLGAHNWYQNRPSTDTPETLAQQVQDLVDMVTYIMEDRALKHGGRRRKTKRRRRRAQKTRRQVRRKTRRRLRRSVSHRRQHRRKKRTTRKRRRR